MNAHISEKQNNMSQLIDAMGKIDGSYGTEDFNEVKQDMLNSGMDMEGLLELIGNAFPGIVLQRDVIDVSIQRLTDTAQVPTYSNPDDACADLYADEDVYIHPGETHLVSTGIALAIPSGHACHIYPRSGISAKTSLRLANSVGVIDAGYRDEIKVPMWNAGTEDVHIIKGMRIAQMDILPSPGIDFYEVEDVKEIGEDRGGGFGHSGLFAETADTNE